MVVEAFEDVVRRSAEFEEPFDDCVFVVFEVDPEDVSPGGDVLLASFQDDERLPIAAVAVAPVDLAAVEEAASVVACEDDRLRSDAFAT